MSPGASSCYYYIYYYYILLLIMPFSSLLPTVPGFHSIYRVVCFLLASPFNLRRIYVLTVYLTTLPVVRTLQSGML
jgi:hypothetical protein